MRILRPLRLRSAAIGQPAGDHDLADVWETSIFPTGLPLLLALIMGISSAVLIVNSLPLFLFPLALIVPATIVFVRYPFIAVIVWLLLFPYVVREPSVAGRIVYWALHRAMIPGTLGIVILADWLRIRKRAPVRFGRADLAMLIFLGLAMANILLLGQTPLQSLIRFYDRLFIPFCMYWLIRLIAPSEQDLKRLLIAAFITLVAQSIIGILSWAAPGALPPQWLGEEGERTIGTFGNPAAYTSTLIFLALLIFQYGIQGRSLGFRMVSLLLYGLAFFCVFISFSRGSWLGGLLVWTGMILVYPRIKLPMTAIVLVLALLTGGVLLSDQIAFALERLQDANTAQARIIGNMASINMILAEPLRGWGYDNYNLYAIQFISSVGNLVFESYHTSHNTYLTIMAEQGVPAFLIYIFPPLWWLLLSWKVRARLPRRGFLSWHLLALLWLLILDHFTVSQFMDMIRFNIFGTTIWWMALGLIANMVYSYLKPGDIGVPRWAYQTKEIEGARTS